MPPAAQRRVKLDLQRPARRAGLGESGGEHHGGLHALDDAIVDGLHRGLGGHRDDRLIDLARRILDRRVGGQPLDLAAVRIDRYDRALEAVLGEAHRPPADAGWVARRADDRDAARTEQRIERMRHEPLTS